MYELTSGVVSAPKLSFLRLFQAVDMSIRLFQAVDMSIARKILKVVNEEINCQQ